MHTAKRAFHLVERDVALYHSRIQAMRLELLLAPGARKEAPLIFVLLQLNDESSWQLCFPKEH
jgi:hypothetical protein